MLFSDKKHVKSEREKKKTQGGLIMTVRIVKKWCISRPRGHNI